MDFCYFVFMLFLFALLFAFTISACETSETTADDIDGSSFETEDTDGVLEGDPSEATATSQALNTKCRQAEAVVQGLCDPETAYDECGLGAFFETIECDQAMDSFFSCVLNNESNDAICTAETPCFEVSVAARDCPTAYCVGEAAYENGCIELFGCTPDCDGKSCGDSDRCGGICTDCPTGETCNATTNMCEADGSQGGGKTTTGRVTFGKSCTDICQDNFGKGVDCAASGTDVDDLCGSGSDTTSFCVGTFLSGGAACTVQCSNDDACSAAGAPGGCSLSVAGGNFCAS